MSISKKIDNSKPITANRLRSYPAELDHAETPERGQIIPDQASMSTYLPEMLSVNEAAEKTNISAEYLRYLCYSGKVNHIKCGRRYMIDSGALAEYIKKGGVE